MTDTNTTPDIIEATVHTPTAAEELMKIAKAYQNRTMAQKYYDDIYEQMAKRAAHGVTQLKDEKKSLAFFQMSFRGMPIPPGVTDLEQHLKDLYDGQEECYKMLEANGFKVTKEEPRFPSLLDPNLTQQQRQLIQNEQMSIEAIVTISLE